MNVPSGFIWSDWWRLLREVNFSIDRGYWLRALQVTIFSYMNTRNLKKEKQLFENEYSKVEIQPPVFILGHWRNGTTLLHELLAMDAQFAFPNLFEISRPHNFLYREPIIEKMETTPEFEKRPMDDMQVNFHSPGEDESALAVLSLRSPTISWMFPRNEDYYDRFLTFNGVSSQDLEAWKQSLVMFMKKLTFRYQQPLLMKSPAHTARIKIILDLFPDARFIHIHRNPMTVFQSTVKLYNTAVKGAHLQNPIEKSLNSGIIRRYKEMYDAFFDQKSLIPPEQFYEIAFSDLENDKIGTLSKIYGHFGIQKFDQAQVGFENYLKRTVGYRKNKFEPIADPLKTEIITAWQRSFDEWGYPVN